MMLYLKKTKNVDDLVLYKNVVGTMVLKGLSVIVNFLSTSLYIHYFSDSLILGVWFTLLSILQWILIFDFGIGNGLRNNLVPFLERNDRFTIRQYVSSGYIALFLLTLFISIIGGIICYNINWNNVINIGVEQISNRDLRIAIFISFIGILLQFFFKIVTSILYAMRKNIVANSTMLFSNILICIYLFGGANIEAESTDKLIYLAFAYGVAIIIPLLIATVWTFSTDLKGLWPSIHFFDLQKAKSVISLGGLFFVIQLELLLIVSTDSWLIGYLYTPEDVVSYQIYFRLFSLPATLYALLSQPIWSSISVALEKGNIDWIRKKESQMYMIAFIVSILSFLIVVFSPILIDVWVGTDNCEVDYTIAVVFAILSTLQVFMYASTSIANGLSKVKCQVLCNSLSVIIKFTFIFLLYQFVSHWSIVVLSEAISLLLIVIIQPIYNRINLNKLLSMK